MQSFKERAERFYEGLSNMLYTLAGTLLILVSFAMILVALWNVVQALRTGRVVGPVLDAISFIVIAIAVLDVGKYLMDEEVFRDRELGSPSEARRALTKFLAILIIALSLEALMFVFESGKEDVRTLIYPTALLLGVGLLVVALGLYQRFSKAVEKMDR